ncbi:hypothetical protein ALC56_09039 [Trachymyrmex septentrionalis]|uniref:Uncharacterized protein n=1 Tax=Trachymyrmex septentrionalis TaxID=34720 RepID=A0A151JUT4_9HYME|nr:hypothetical protein ALC56_09039 [Trachymyrmex septentrionalis]
MCLRKLSLVDDTMEAIGSPKKYQRLRKWILRITIGYIVYMFFRFATFTLRMIFFYQININYYVIILSLSYVYPHFVHFSSTLIWGTILGYVSFRFHQVSDRLHVLSTSILVFPKIM